MAPPLGYPKQKTSSFRGRTPLTPDQAHPPDSRAFPSSKFATTLLLIISLRVCLSVCVSATLMLNILETKQGIL